MRTLWSPIRDILQRHARVGRAVGEPVARTWGRSPGRHGALPRLDFSERQDAFIVRIDLPGVRREDIVVAVAAGDLEIKGELPVFAVGDEAQVRRSERPGGPFRRVVPIPRQADADSVSASMSDGVLTITMRKRGPDSERVIAVE